MSIGDFFMEITKFMLPGILVAGTVFFLLNKYFANENRKRLYEMKINNQKAALPIRLAAYERLTILLERMSANNLILRVIEPGMSASNLHAALLTEIRAEVEHNQSQQLYISVELWNMIKYAKEETIKMINISLATIPPGSSAVDLSKVIFEFSMKEDYPPSYKALLYLKREALDLF